MTKVSPAQRNELFLSSKLWANPQLVSWLLMNMNFQKHNQLLWTAHLVFLQAPLLSLMSRTQVLSQLLRLSCTLGFLGHLCSPLCPLSVPLDCSVYQFVTWDRFCRQVSSEALILSRGKYVFCFFHATKLCWNAWSLNAQGVPSVGIQLRLVPVSVGWVIKSPWGTQAVKFRWVSSPCSCKADGVLAAALLENTVCRGESKCSACEGTNALSCYMGSQADSPQYFKCTANTVHLRAKYWWKSKHESRSCHSFFGPFLGAISLTLSWQLEPKVNFTLICLLAIYEVIPCSPGNPFCYKDNDHKRK